mmetsp:Transcript_17514/g.20218  ORF Transcript_17514/g.20218 Transcript_17514/m.20218 type:complete len:370 (+) Transcript_17514:186-1295(+)|eukprot:CAMPEP_0194142300 /NCGR_PEP_ID=MMETSP0152-20130528/11597_1 /TAXON_ID=1049557 /ORGANISM="Thalassiothrix antarctica, Strain L6-D1" /LENGTH=369 /DNA_ID=CAMNT_0038841217 /DNA_START=143 /DNA_END=1252 /DNA_ORIENTATION=+
MSTDRTAEFMALARSLPSANKFPGNDTVAPPVSGRYNRNDPSYIELRNFHTTASGISKDIAATSHMLAELTKLVKSTSSLFAETDSQHVNVLVLRIKQSVESLNGRLEEANSSLQYQKRRFNAQARQEASNLVIQLKEEFVETTAGFKKVLMERTDNMNDASDQKAQVYGGEVDFVSLDNKPAVYGESKLSSNVGFPMLDLTSGMSAGEPTGSPLPRPHGVLGDIGNPYNSGVRMRRSYNSDTHNLTDSNDGPPLTPLDIQRMEQETGQQMQLIPDQGYLLERADAMSQVESNIVELGTIFNKLAVMVSEHREMVERVEDNVEDTNMNLNMSMNVLTDTLRDLKSNRALMTKLFGVLVGFIIMFIVFFA